MVGRRGLTPIQRHASGVQFRCPSVFPNGYDPKVYTGFEQLLRKERCTEQIDFGKVVGSDGLGVHNAAVSLVVREISRPQGLDGKAFFEGG